MNARAKQWKELYYRGRMGEKKIRKKIKEKTIKDKETVTETRVYVEEEESIYTRAKE